MGADVHRVGDAGDALHKWRLATAQQAYAVLFGGGLTVLLLWLALGDAPESLSVRALALLAMLPQAVAIVGRRLSPALRLWLALGSIYGGAVLVLVWFPGDMARLWLLATPIMALVLGGPLHARWGAGVSAVIVLCHAVAKATGLIDAWRLEGFDPGAVSTLALQAAGWLAPFGAVMFLLLRLHAFQVVTLNRAHAAAASLAEEIGRRQAAHEALARAAADRERLQREIARVGDEERRRLGQDLHDGVSQELSAALLRCVALEERVKRAAPETAEDVEALIEALEGVLGGAQEIARGLCPVDMAPEAIGSALRALAGATENRTGVRCTYREEGDVGLEDGERTLHLYRVAQEAVNNAAKHAHAGRIAISLSGSPESVLLTVEDDGCGLPDPVPAGGLGMGIMAYRAETLGAGLALERSADGGTRIVCRVPRGGTDGS